MIVLRALALGWADLLRPRILQLVLMGVALTLLLFVALQGIVFALIRAFAPGSFSLPFIGTIEVGTLLSWGSLALFPLANIFLMAPVAAGFAGLFAENVADAVERIHYPRRLGTSPAFWDGLIESLAVIAAVLVVAILSLMLTPFLGPLAPLLFYGANGWLLGREFFQMAARRHMDAPQATALRKRHGVAVTAAGILVAVALSVPVVNIGVPLLAAAAFTHLYQIISANRDRSFPDRRG